MRRRPLVVVLGRTPAIAPSPAPMEQLPSLSFPPRSSVPALPRLASPSDKMLSPISKALGGGRRALFAKNRAPAAAAVKSPPARAMLTRLALQQAFLSGSATKDAGGGAGAGAGGGAGAGAGSGAGCGADDDSGAAGAAAPAAEGAAATSAHAAR